MRENGASLGSQGPSLAPPSAPCGQVPGAPITDWVKRLMKSVPGAAGPEVHSWGLPGGWAVAYCALVQQKCYSRWGPGDSFWAEGLDWVLDLATSMGQTFLAMTVFAPSW